MLPRGGVVLDFNSPADAETACGILSDYKFKREKSKTLDVITDGSATQFADILTRLEQNGITIARFTQKLPTLEDVFLTLIGEKAAPSAAPQRSEEA